MDVEIRGVGAGEFPAWVRACEATFGLHPSDELIERLQVRLPLDRTLGAFDGDDVVGTAAAYDFRVTVPGGAVLPTSGITFVGVLPTHRRRGVLRRLMTRQLDDIARRGESLALLTASESSIYGRFGYGEASHSLSWSLRPAGAVLRRPPTAPGRMRLATAARLREVAPGIYERAMAGVPGALARSPEWWDNHLADHVENRDGAPAMFHAVHETPDGEVDGYVSWRSIERWTPEDLPDNEIRVQGLHGVDREVEAALFQFLLDLDLVGVIKAADRPVDEHLRWRLVDRRRMAVDNIVEGLYVRILDPAVALGARRYGTTDALVLELSDPFRPSTDGRWLLEGGPNGATCARTDRAPDLTMDVAELGSLYLGGVPASTLARAGRIEERVPGAVVRADAFFRSGVAPWLTFGF